MPCAQWWALDGNGSQAVTPASVPIAGPKGGARLSALCLGPGAGTAQVEARGRPHPIRQLSSASFLLAGGFENLASGSSLTALTPSRAPRPRAARCFLGRREPPSVPPHPRVRLAATQLLSSSSPCKGAGRGARFQVVCPEPLLTERPAIPRRREPQASDPAVQALIKTERVLSGFSSSRAQKRMFCVFLPWFF